MQSKLPHTCTARFCATCRNALPEYETRHYLPLDALMVNIASGRYHLLPKCSSSTIPVVASVTVAGALIGREASEDSIVELDEAAQQASGRTQLQREPRTRGFEPRTPSLRVRMRAASGGLKRLRCAETTARTRPRKTGLGGFDLTQT